MNIEYDEGAPGYRSPKDRVEDLKKEYEKPSERGLACSAILEFIEKELDESISAFIDTAAAVLNITKDDVRKRGLSGCRELWLARKQVDLERKRLPIWYFAHYGDYCSPPTVNRPRDGADRVDGPMAVPEEEIESERQNYLQKLEAQEWNEIEIARAVNDYIQGRDEFKASSQKISIAYSRAEQIFSYRNIFRNESVEIKTASETILDLGGVDSSNKGEKKDRKIKPIPWAGSEQQLAQVFEELGKAELVDTQTSDGFRSLILPHFSVSASSSNVGRDVPLREIRWRTTLYELDALFEWFQMNLFLNEVEGRRSALMIEQHFINSDGHKIKRNTVSVMRTIAVHQAPKLKAKGRIEEILRDVTRP